ncbi:hypothetical protein Plhal304r1_c043g0123511 [Plasmopara halstedii]
MLVSIAVSILQKSLNTGTLTLNALSAPLLPDCRISPQRNSALTVVRLSAGQNVNRIEPERSAFRCVFLALLIATGRKLPVLVL